MSNSVYSLLALRRAGWQFLTGKVASATLTFAILLWLVRLLPVAEYGAYVVLIAGTELGYAIAGLGLPWLAARYVPEYRINADGTSLAKLCSRLVLWQALALMTLAALISATLSMYLEWVGLLPYRSAAWIAVVLLITEGLARFKRDGLMGPLMMQSELRSSLILRQFAFLTSIATLDFTGNGSLSTVLTAECGSAMLGLIWARIGLKLHFARLHGQPVKSGWHEPTLSSQWQVALRMYSAHLITLAYSPQVLLNLVQRTLGTEATALFGFLRTLYEQISRHLPATLLFSIIRPKLMASYVNGGVVELERNANLAGKLSLFALMPVIVVIAIAGDIFVALLSGNKFADGGTLLMGLLVALIPASQRYVIETVAVAVGRVSLCTWGAVAGLLALPLVAWLLHSGLGLWAPVISIIFGHTMFNAVVLTCIARQPGYRADWVGSSKLALSAALAWLTTSWIAGGMRAQSVGWIGLACGLAVITFLTAAWWLKPFGEAERQRINAMAGRRVFVW